MVRKSKKAAPPERQVLVARIESFEQSYYISSSGDARAQLGDEALLAVAARIEQVSPKLKQHLGEAVEITFGCAASYPADGGTPERAKPLLLYMHLSKRRRGFMVYLPPDAIWALPRMIETGKATHIEAIFEPIRYGSGALLSVYLSSSAPLIELQADPLFSRPLVGAIGSDG